MLRHTPQLRDVSGRRAAATTALRSILTATALVTVYFNVPVRADVSVRAGALLALGLLGFIVLLAVQVRSITQADRPRLRAIEVLATVAPLFVVLFAMSYFVLSRSSGSAFSEPLSRLDALYFAVTIFATVGFGDIVARSDTARMLVTIQMVGDLIVLGLGLRVLVGAVRIGLTRQRSPDSDDAVSPPDFEPTLP